MIEERRTVHPPLPRRRRLIRFAVRALTLAAVLVVSAPGPATAQSYVPVAGAGSSWSFNAIDQWRRDVAQYGMRINYAGTGSSDGRRQWLNGTVDFAASDIPFQFRPEDGSSPENPPAGSYAYIPVTAGGTVFMYNLSINGQKVTNLRLSGANVAKIFTGVITNWNDPAIATDNPGLTMPNKKIVPVVRSDGSGSSAQFTTWMIAQQPSVWNDYCKKTGRSACGLTSYYPTVSGMIAQAGDLGVAGYVSQSYADGAIGYVNYSYALNTGYPVVKMLNAAGYYTEPTAQNVAVSLLKAKINTDPASEAYLTQNLSEVYTNADPRSYPLSSYSYMILPTKVQGSFSEDKGKTLAAFAYFAMCQGQQQSESLGYSPMPINLVEASFDQIKKVPGAVVQDVDIAKCNNPTFSADGHNTLADKAPQPEACDKQGATQCATGTGGAKKTPTAVKTPAATGGATGTGGAATGGGTSAGGGATGGGATGTGTNGAATAGGATPGGATVAGVTPGGATAAGGTPGAATPGGAAPGALADGTGSADSSGGLVDAAGNPVDPSSCDPASGLCSTAEGATEPGGGLLAASAPGGGVVTANPYTLPGDSGWGASQALVIAVALFLMALIVSPGVAVVAMRRKGAQ